MFAVAKITSILARPDPHGHNGVETTMVVSEVGAIPDFTIAVEGQPAMVVFVKRTVTELTLKNCPMMVTDSDPEVEPEEGTKL